MAQRRRASAQKNGRKTTKKTAHETAQETAQRKPPKKKAGQTSARAARPSDQREAPKARRPRVSRAEQQRMSAEELGGESEYSQREALRDERGTTHRKARGAYTREPLTYEPSIHELGRRYLEEATQAPVDLRDIEDEEEPVRLPGEEPGEE